MRTLIVMLAVVMGLSVGTSVYAQDAAPAAPAAPGALAAPAVAVPVPVELTGKVVVTKNDQGAITQAVLKVGEGDQAQQVAVKLDDNGKKMAQTVTAEQLVKVVGIVTEVAGKKTIAVVKFSVVEPEQEAEGEAELPEQPQE